MRGILGVLLLRAILILIGAWLIAQFHWILYLFRRALPLPAANRRGKCVSVPRPARRGIGDFTCQRGCALTRGLGVHDSGALQVDVKRGSTQLHNATSEQKQT